MMGDQREAEAFERSRERHREPGGGKGHGNGPDSCSHIVIHIAEGPSTVLRLAHDPFVSSEVETPFGLVSSRGASRLRSMRTGLFVVQHVGPSARQGKIPALFKRAMLAKRPYGKAILADEIRTRRQIGRASCGERVCQQLSITVVAVSYNKKITITEIIH